MLVGLQPVISKVLTDCDSFLSCSAKKRSFEPASAWVLADGRLHLQHGPIDLLIDAKGEAHEVRQAYARAVDVFATVLETLTDELVELRTPLAADSPEVSFSGPVAQRMLASIEPYRGVLLTPMVAVAGAVADHVLQYVKQGAQLSRLAINNGGDISLELQEDETYRIGVVADSSSLHRDAHIVIDRKSGVGGIATSGWRGRSHSLGIADAVTVLAGSAAAADVAATLIANAVDAPGAAGIRRQAAVELAPDSDLRHHQVTVDVGDLDPAAIALAMRSGVHMAEQFYASGLLLAVYIQLKNEVAVVGDAHPLLESVDGTSEDS